MSNNFKKRLKAALDAGIEYDLAMTVAYGLIEPETALKMQNDHYEAKHTCQPINPSAYIPF
jgi:hypothetical protein